MYLAVDIGATKVLLAVFKQDGQIVEQIKFATPSDYPDLIKAFATELKSLQTHDFTKAVVAVPGLLNRKSGIAIAFGNRPWQNVPIRDDFEKVLACPVKIENDSKLAALSEAIVIKNDFRKVLYVTISTGISSGLIVDGVIDPELADSESGQMWFDHNGKPTQWEDFASGRSIVETYGQKASEITDPKIWQEISHNIAVGLVELVAILQPEVVVLGGGVGAHFAKFKTPLMTELKKYEVPMAPLPPIIKAARPEEAVIYGCFELAKAS